MGISDHYVDNQKFLSAMIEYLDQCKQAEKDCVPYPQPSNYIGECIYAIADGLSKKGNFINYSYRDEMVSDAVENAITYIRNFDPAKSQNPFAYFTQICYYAFLRRIKKEKKQQFIVYSMINEANNRGTFEQWAKKNGIEVDGSDALAGYLNLTSNDLQSFESKKNVKKKKKKTSDDDNNLEDLMEPEKETDDNE